MGRAQAMAAATDPATYEAWYHTPCGAWIGERESSLLLALMRPARGQTLLDVGCGTGYFSRRFAAAGLVVTGIDPDPAMVQYASLQAGAVNYLEADVRALPFANRRFDYCTAVTSLCFVDEPRQALAEMWRVSRRGVALGLLNRHSLLYRAKQGRGGYQGARWDTWRSVRRWLAQLAPPVAGHWQKTAVFFRGGGRLARVAEPLLGGSLPWGGFLAVYVAKRDGTDDRVDYP